MPEGLVERAEGKLRELGRRIILQRGAQVHAHIADAVLVIADLQVISSGARLPRTAGEVDHDVHPVAQREPILARAISKDPMTRIVDGREGQEHIMVCRPIWQPPTIMSLPSRPSFQP